jgi:hypothetical protein
MNAKEIRELFQKHGLAVSRSDIWEIQDNPVIHHKAVERLGVMIGIEWHQPQILRAEKDEAVMIVTGKVGERLEWSVGEAAIGQNYRVSGKQAAYVFCMAEKRGRDRVILKLAGLHGAYSEEEADDFKQGAEPEEEPSTFGVTKGFFKHGAKPEEEQQAGSYEQGLPPVPMPVPPTRDSRSVYVENSLNLIEQIQTPEAVSAWLDREVEQGVWKQYGITEHQDDGKAILMACKRRRLELRNAA